MRVVSATLPPFFCLVFISLVFLFSISRWSTCPLQMPGSPVFIRLPACPASHHRAPHSAVFSASAWSLPLSHICIYKARFFLNHQQSIRHTMYFTYWSIFYLPYTLSHVPIQCKAHNVSDFCPIMPAVVQGLDASPAFAERMNKWMNRWTAGLEGNRAESRKLPRSP